MGRGTLWWTTNGLSEYEDYKSPVFSSDGTRLAYVAAKDKKELVVVDGRPGRVHDRAGDIAFSPNGKRFGYLAMEGKTVFAVVDGQPGRAYPGPVASGFRFSPNGKHVAYAVGNGEKVHIVLDGHDGLDFDGMAPGGPTFQADGTLEYLGARAGTLYRIRHLISAVSLPRKSLPPGKTSGATVKK
jgi:hypothetical protein